MQLQTLLCACARSVASPSVCLLAACCVALTSSYSVAMVSVPPPMRTVLGVEQEMLSTLEPT